MALARWTATAQDAEGNAVAGCSIEVRSEDTGRLVQVYADRAGAVALGNPFVAPEATFWFHVEGGAYKVTATKGPFQSIWPYVAIGTASEFDYDQLIYELQAGLMPVATFAEIDGQAPGVDQSLAAIVLADPDPMRNGYYLWSEGAGQWQRKRPLPDTLARLTVIGGTANALEALASPGVDPGAVLAFFIDVPMTNTGPVTLSINGAPALPVLDVNGDDFAPGVFTGRLFLSNEGDHLQALVGGDILAAAAQALAQANRAEDMAERAEQAAVSVESPVSYAPQALTSSQQEQARSNIGARADSGAYGRDNILGPVSQVGGVPTGGIIERGENANGAYTRFADGTQICRGVATVDHTGTYSSATRLYGFWNFPAVFIEGSVHLSMNVGVDNSGNFIGCSRANVINWGTNTVEVESHGVYMSVFFSGGVSTTNARVENINLIAIGRWF